VLLLLQNMLIDGKSAEDSYSPRFLPSCTDVPLLCYGRDDQWCNPRKKSGEHWISVA